MTRLTEEAEADIPRPRRWRRVVALDPTPTTTSPSSVNLTAFPTRLRSTSCSRPALPTRASGQFPVGLNVTDQL